MIINCWNCKEDKEHYAHQVCRKCYRSLSGEASKSYNKKKNDPAFRAMRSKYDKKYKDKLREEGLLKDRQAKYYQDWISKPENKLRKALYDRKWRTVLNPDAYRQIDQKSKDKKYFDGMRNIVFDKYGHTCAVCSMSDEQSILKWKSKLSIHHVDGNGRMKSKDQKNNELDNLILLCKSCHGRVELSKIDLTSYLK